MSELNYWLAFISYMIIAATVLVAGYHKVDWYLSSQRGEELKDIFACYTVAIFWPFFWAIGLSLAALKASHTLMVRITK